MTRPPAADVPTADLPIITAADGAAAGPHPAAPAPSESTLPAPDGTLLPEYDAVVIGSGIGGLTAAAVAARAGLGVLLVERAPGHGGCTREIRLGERVFDRAVHVTGQGAPGEIYDDLLRHLGVRDEVELLPVGHGYAVSSPAGTFRAPTGFEAFVEAHAAAFPADATGIRSFLALCEQVHREAHSLPPSLGPAELDAAVARHPVLFGHVRLTLAEVLAEHVSDPAARAACAGSWPYVGVPPQRLSFLTFTQMLFSQMEGTYHCRGGFQRLADALLLALRRHGGDFVAGTAVERVEVGDGRVTGVRLADGRRVRCRTVIGAGDVTRLLGTTLDGGTPTPRVLRAVERGRPSWSAFAVYAVTRAPLTGDVAHETFRYRHLDHADTAADIAAGRPGGMWLTVPTLVDPTVAPPGEHLLVMTSLARYDVPGGWEAAGPRYRDELVAEIRRTCPAVGDDVEVLHTVSPVTLERDTGNRSGAIYGWDYLPAQSGGRRMSHRTGVDGLLLAGHWTQPGAATLRVLVSGVHAAQLALRDAGLTRAADLGLRDLPPI